MKGEKVDIQVDPVVYDTPLDFHFRPIKKNESVFLYRGRVLSAFDDHYNAHARKYGLISGDGAPHDARTGKRKRGAKWVMVDKWP